MRYDCGHMNTRVIIIAAIGISGVHPQQSLQTAPQTHYLCSILLPVPIKPPLKSATIFLADGLCSCKCLKQALRYGILYKKSVAMKTDKNQETWVFHMILQLTV